MNARLMNWPQVQWIPSIISRLSSLPRESKPHNSIISMRIFILPALSTAAAAAQERNQSRIEEKLMKRKCLKSLNRLMKIYNHNNNEELLAIKSEMWVHSGDISRLSRTNCRALDYFVGMPVTSTGIPAQLEAPRRSHNAHLYSIKHFITVACKQVAAILANQLIRGHGKVLACLCRFARSKQQFYLIIIWLRSDK
jgi:hypothetical protein